MKLPDRRDFLRTTSATIAISSTSAFAADPTRPAADLLKQDCDSGQTRAAAIWVRQGTHQYSHVFGAAKDETASFLLGSISKPIAITALLRLLDQGLFGLDDLVSKYIPKFTGQLREQVTIRHLLTHVSGLQDQLPDNAELRAGHAPLSRFVSGAVGLPLHFPPGTEYRYSSMGILLALEIARRLTSQSIPTLVNKTVLEPLRMQNSELGSGRLSAAQLMQSQTEYGAVESGAGSPDAAKWNWNSHYWRGLGAPWGGLQASANDVGRFLQEYLHPTGILFSSATTATAIRNHNPTTLESRGLGFDTGMEATCQACSAATFGHTGSTGTIAWADPRRDLICVVLTTLPARALPAAEHPRQRASDLISAAFP